MRWIWIDRFVEFRSGQFARAVKNLSLAEDIYRDHFPGYPVIPAALILEGLAQTGGILVGEANQFSEKVVLAKIQRAVFHREMLAGEQLVYEQRLPGMARFSGMVLRPRSGNAPGDGTAFAFPFPTRSRDGNHAGEPAGQDSKMSRGASDDDLDARYCP